MKAQFKYSLREHLTPRAIVVSAVIIMNLVFGIMGYNDLYGQAWKITAVSLCSSGLFGIFIVCIITDFEMLRNICSAPSGYVTILTPVNSRKIILSRVITIIAEDLLLYAIGIAGIVVQSFILAGLPWDRFYNEQSVPFLWLLIIVVLGYIYTVLLVLFCIILSKSIFFTKRVGVLLALITMAVTAYAFSLLDFTLIPFGVVKRIHFFYSVQLVMGANAGMFAYILLNLCKSAALFFASAYLLERKINI